MTLEDIGQGVNALLCITNLSACCLQPYGFVIGNWFFPNATKVPSGGNQSDFFRTRGQVEVHLNRNKGEEEGIYRCEIPDSINALQIIYIGVYTATTGE